MLIGYDLNLGFPAGFADALRLDGDGPAWRRTWDYLTALLNDTEGNANNRFEVAALLNERCMPAESSAVGPFWGCPAAEVRPSLRPTSPAYPFATADGRALRRLRWTEQREPRVQPVWKVAGRGSVGGQTLVGIPHVARLRDDPQLAAYSAAWPFETGFFPRGVSGAEPLIIHAEIWPGVLGKRIDPALIRDQAQVRATVDWLAECDRTGELATLLSAPDGLGLEASRDCIEEEGWILGSGHASVEAEAHTPDNATASAGA